MAAALSALSAVRTLLVGDSQLIALVPVGRMYPISFPTTATFPCITYSALNESDTQFADDLARSELASVEVQVWENVGLSPTTIAQNVARIFRADGWVRDFSSQFRYTVNGQPYQVLRFTKLLTY